MVEGRHEFSNGWRSERRSGNHDWSPDRPAYPSGAIVGQRSLNDQFCLIIKYRPMSRRGYVGITDHKTGLVFLALAPSPLTGDGLQP